MEAVAFALTSSLRDVLARELAIIEELQHGPHSKALRHLFFAERRAVQMPDNASPWPVRRVGVVGGGTIGSNIALAFADVGLDVTLVEVGEAQAQAAEQRVSAIYDRQLHDGRLTERLHQERTGRIRYTTELRSLRDSDLVIEAVIEDLAAKQAVFRALSPLVRRDVVLASNTSYLDIELLADEVDAPERAIGLHFFSPAHVMGLVEIVRPQRALPEVIATALAIVRRLRKQAVLSGVADGFIGNGILRRWRAQCEYALEDGAWPEDLDAALEAYGFAMGIFAAFDMAGLDVDWSDRKRTATTRDPGEHAVPVFDSICERGRSGQKTGRGFYVHQDGKRVPDPEVTALIERPSAARESTRRAVPAEEIQWRAHAAIVNEGPRVLTEGGAARPSDVDVLLVHGCGYPAWRRTDARGGRHRHSGVLRRVEAPYEASGVGWEPIPLLREMAAAGKRFADLNG